MATVTVRKNATEIIKIERGEYQGTHLLHARVWYDDGSGEYKASRIWPGRVAAAILPRYKPLFDHPLGFTPTLTLEIAPATHIATWKCLLRHPDITSDPHFGPNTIEYPLSSSAQRTRAQSGGKN